MGSWNLQPFRLGSRSSFLTPALEQHARLELLYPADGAANAIVDIILVAGLGGDYIKTWQAEDGTLWPRDLLPKKLPNIRVQSFQYNTTIQGTTSKAKIADHAVQLLNALNIDRTESTDVEAVTRPIIFIGHSLGGMLIKYTVHYAFTHHQYGGLWDATRGVMFFATPHHGMDFRSWRDFASAVLRLQAPFPGVLPTEKMLKDISLNTDNMVQITEDFKPLQRELAFVNILERNIMKGQDRVLVDKSHGWMDADPAKKQEYLIEGDHVGVCRFGTRYKSDTKWFKLVLKSMKFLIEQSPKAIDQIDGDARRALHSLCPTGFHGYFMAKEPTEGTCNWISERPEFQEWLDDQNDKQMLWIQGPPACGKSYLAKHIITELAPAANKEVSHCFLSDSVPGRGNVTALLRATLHHALRREPKLISKILVPPFLKATKGKAVRVRDDDIWTRDLLIYLWPDAIADVLGFRPLTLVVDGFDQIDKTSRQEFLNCLAECKEKAGPERTQRLRVLLLSTESEADVDEEGKPAEPLQGREEFQVYHVTAEDTLPDRERTIMGQLKNPEGEFGTLDSAAEGTGGAELQRKEICEAILEHSNGSYQLATKAAEVLSKSLVTTAKQVEAAKEIVQNLPRNDTDFLAKQLNELLENAVGPSLLRHVLSWVLCQLEPLLEAEFCTAVAVGMALDEQSHGMASRGTVSSERLLQRSRLVDQTKALVQTHCRQLIELGDGPVKSVNSGLKKLLRAAEAMAKAEDLAATTQLNPGLAKYLDDRTCHATLARTCIAYLTLPCFQDAGIPLKSETGSSEMWKSKVRRRIKSYPFVRYASFNWFEHLKVITGLPESREGTGDDEFGDEYHDQDQEKLQLLQDGATGYAQSWTEVYWFLTNGGNMVGAEEEKKWKHFPADPVIQVHCPNPRPITLDSSTDLFPTKTNIITPSPSVDSEPSTLKQRSAVVLATDEEIGNNSDITAARYEDTAHNLLAEKMDHLDGVGLEFEPAEYSGRKQRATTGDVKHAELMPITPESVPVEFESTSDDPAAAKAKNVEHEGNYDPPVVDRNIAATTTTGSGIREVEKQEDISSMQAEMGEQGSSDEGRLESSRLESAIKEVNEVEPIITAQNKLETERSTGRVEEEAAEESRQTKAAAVSQAEIKKAPEVDTEREPETMAALVSKEEAERGTSANKSDVGLKEGKEEGAKENTEAEAVGKEGLLATQRWEYSDARTLNDGALLSMGRPDPPLMKPRAKSQNEESQADAHRHTHTKALLAEHVRVQGTDNGLRLRPEPRDGPSTLAKDNARPHKFERAATQGGGGGGSKQGVRIGDNGPSGSDGVQAERANSRTRAVEESTGHIPSTPDKKLRGLARMYAKVKTGIKNLKLGVEKVNGTS